MTPAVPGAAGVGRGGAEEELEALELPHVAAHAIVQDGGQEAAGGPAGRHAAALTRPGSPRGARKHPLPAAPGCDALSAAAAGSAMAASVGLHVSGAA